MNKKIRFLVFCASALSFFIAGAVAFHADSADAGAIKTWSNGETLKSADLNANFNHIHNLMVGGHGARLVNADVSTTAAIAHSKLATPALVPKAWAALSATCTSGTCSLGDSSQVTTITFSATGVYNVTLAYAPTDTNFLVNVTPRATGTFTTPTSAPICFVTSTSTTAPHIQVSCVTTTTTANTFTAVNAQFYLTVLDT